MANPEPKFFERYTVLVTESDLVAALTQQVSVVGKLLGNLSDARANQVDPPYGWTIKQVVQHMIDAERVFSYRALRFSRGDKTPLPGFDENEYASAVDVTDRTLGSLVTEFVALREANVLMFRELPEAAWRRTGIASGMEWSVTDLARSIIGHARHHLQIIEKRLSR